MKDIDGIKMHGATIKKKFFVSGPLFDSVAQCSEGVKRGMLRASSMAFL